MISFEGRQGVRVSEIRSLRSPRRSLKSFGRVALVEFEPSPEHSLGRAWHREFYEFTVENGGVFPNRAWRLLANLSAHAAGHQIAGVAGPRLQPFMFEQKANASAKAVLPNLKGAKDLSSTYAKLDVAYAYMSRQEEITLYGLGQVASDTINRFLNHRIGLLDQRENSRL